MGIHERCLAISAIWLLIGGLEALGETSSSEPSAGGKASSTAFENGGVVFSGGLEIGWDYGDNKMGLPPANWGQINDVCQTGERQSPINIVTAGAKAGPATSKKTSLSWDYQPTAAVVRNDGKSLIVDVSTNTRNELVVDKKRFVLHQYRFHSPSEHKIDGMDFPLEMQMLHRGKQGKLVILSVLFATSDAVRNNPFLESIWQKMPGYGSLSGAMIERIVPMEALPSSPNFFAYSGSLTTPPCQEKVMWVIMKQPALVSFQQILKMRAALRLDDKHSPTLGNARPVMDTGDRVVYKDSAPTDMLNDVPEPGCVQIDATPKLAKERLRKSQKLSQKTSSIEKEGTQLVQDEQKLGEEADSARQEADKAQKAYELARSRSADMSAHSHVKSAINTTGDAAMSAEMTAERSTKAVKSAVDVEKERVLAQVAEKNAKMARQKVDHVQFKEKSVKGKLKINQKAAQEAVEDAISQNKASALTEQIKKECSSKVAEVKNDFRARHLSDTDKMRKDEEKSTKATATAMTSEKELKQMKSTTDKTISALTTKEQHGEVQEKSSAKKQVQAEQMVKDEQELKAREKAESAKLQSMSETHSRDSKELGEARRDLQKLNQKLADEKLTDEKLRSELKVDQEKAKRKEQQLHDRVKNAEEAITAQKERVAGAKQDARKRELRIQELKSGATEKKLMQQDENKLEIARRKEMTAIKVATKEQEARMQEQAKLHAEKRVEDKLKDQDMKLAKAAVSAHEKEKSLEKAISQAEKEATRTKHAQEEEIHRMQKAAKQEMRKEEEKVSEMKSREKDAEKKAAAAETKVDDEKRKAESQLQDAKVAAAEDKAAAVEKAERKGEKVKQDEIEKAQSQLSSDEKSDRQRADGEEQKVEQQDEEIGKLKSENEMVKANLKKAESDVQKEKKLLSDQKTQQLKTAETDKVLLGKLKGDFDKQQKKYDVAKVMAEKEGDMEQKKSMAEKELAVQETKNKELKDRMRRVASREVREAIATKCPKCPDCEKLKQKEGSEKEKEDRQKVQKEKQDLDALTKEHKALQEAHQELKDRLKKAEEELSTIQKTHKAEIEALKTKQKADAKSVDAEVGELKDAEEKDKEEAVQAKAEQKIAEQKVKDAKKEVKLEKEVVKAEQQKEEEKKKDLKQEVKAEEDRIEELRKEEKEEKQKEESTKQQVRDAENKLEVKQAAEKETEKEGCPKCNCASSGAGSGAGQCRCPKCPKCKAPEPCPKPMPQFKDVGDSQEKYQKMKEKYAACQVESSNAISNLKSVKQLQEKFKKEAKVCQTKLTEAQQSSVSNEPGPAITVR